jgi:hypothetical protein
MRFTRLETFLSSFSHFSNRRIAILTPNAKQGTGQTSLQQGHVLAHNIFKMRFTRFDSSLFSSSRFSN